MSKDDLKKQERIGLVTGLDAKQADSTGFESGTDAGAGTDVDAGTDIGKSELQEGEVFQSAGETSFDVDNETIAFEKTALPKSTSAEDTLIGQTIAARFEIISKLGEGGMAVVYKARHLMLNRIVALKLIKPGIMHSKAAQRFQQEAKAATSLNHNNIATVREFGYDENGAYLVMDFVEGVSLSDALKENGKLSAERTKNIISQVCEGLKHAHDSGVIHRDLKPANIILARNAKGDEFPKIVDFGIAKLVDEENEANLTQTGEIFGTPNYMSPEQCLGKKADQRSDVYSVGCVMHECLTGKAPFASDSSIETLMKHVNEQFKPSSKQAPNYFMTAIKGCLEKKPDDRWQSVSDLREFLQEPKGPAQKKYKNREKHFSRKQIITIAIISTIAGIALAAFASFAPLTGIVTEILFPNSWQRLAHEAQGQSALGPSNYLNAKTSMIKAIQEAKRADASELEMEGLYIQFARLLSNMRDRAASKKYFALALNLNEKHGEDLQRGSMHDWLAQIYLDEKNYPQAIQEAQAAVDIKKRTIGERQRVTLLSYFRLGQAYRGVKQYTKAEEVDRKVLELTNQLYPEKDDLLTADAHEQLGNALMDQGKGEEAIKNHMIALPIVSKICGNSHPRTKKVLNKICAYLEKRSKPAEADQLRKAYPEQSEI